MMKEWLEMFKHLYQLQKQVHSELRIDHKTQVRTILENGRPHFPQQMLIVWLID